MVGACAQGVAGSVPSGSASLAVDHPREEHRSLQAVNERGVQRSEMMKIFSIVLMLGVFMTGPALAASESAKMTGQDQNATAPARHRAQSAKMHKNHQRQNSISPSGNGTANMGGGAEK